MPRVQIFVTGTMSRSIEIDEETLAEWRADASKSPGDFKENASERVKDMPDDFEVDEVIVHVPGQDDIEANRYSRAKKDE
jgi:transposase-like protein